MRAGHVSWQFGCLGPPESLSSSVSRQSASMTSSPKTWSRRKTLIISGAFLLCCIGVFAFCISYVVRDPDGPPPSWFGYVCGITALVGMVSLAVFVTSVAFGLFRRGKKISDHH